MNNRADPVYRNAVARTGRAVLARARGALPRSVAAIFGLCVALSACSWLPQEVDETKGWSAQKLYNAAKEELDSGSYERAVKLYEKLEARYPYGQYAQQAQIEIAYAYYKEKEPASAIAAADRFIKLYPNHANLDYAY